MTRRQRRSPAIIETGSSRKQSAGRPVSPHGKRTTYNNNAGVKYNVCYVLCCVARLCASEPYYRVKTFPITTHGRGRWSLTLRVRRVPSLFLFCVMCMCVDVHTICHCSEMAFRREKFGLIFAVRWDGARLWVCGKS